MLGGPGCVETGDDDCAMESIAKGFNKVNEFLGMKATFYQMRDSILSKSINGNIIINKYQTAGKYIANNLSQINLTHIYSFVTLLYNKTTFLINNPTSNQILIDATTKNDALGMINDLRLIDSETEWQQCLDWMVSIINQFVNMPASSVNNFIRS